MSESHTPSEIPSSATDDAPHTPRRQNLQGHGQQTKSSGGVADWPSFLFAGSSFATRLFGPKKLQSSHDLMRDTADKLTSPVHTPQQQHSFTSPQVAVAGAGPEDGSSSTHFDDDLERAPSEATTVGDIDGSSFTSNAPSSTSKKKGSFFSNVFRSNSSNRFTETTPDTAAATKGTGKRPPMIGAPPLRSRVVLLGESGSGKSTFKACCTSSSVMKRLPDVKPSNASGSSYYYFKTPRRERLDILVVDGGPLPLHYGPCLQSGPSTMYLIALPLTAVKQLPVKKSFFSSSSSTKGSVLLHPADVRSLRENATTIAAAGAHGVSLGVVATHKDLLSDQSKDAVERVLSELHDTMGQITAELGLEGKVRFFGCFAVAATDHSCASENRGGPKNIAELWELLCDMNVKDALAHRGSTEAGPFTAELLRTSFLFKQFDALQQEHEPRAWSPAISETTTASATMSPDRVLNDELSRVSNCVTTFLHRAKSELGFALIPLHTFIQVAFSSGMFSRQHVMHVLAQMEAQGEIKVFRRQPRHIGGREECILLAPHLVSRAATAIYKYVYFLRYPLAERTRQQPSIDIGECDRADPDNLLGNEGHAAPQLLVALSRCFQFIRKNLVDCVELFMVVLLLSDMVVQLPLPQIELEGPIADDDQGSGAIPSPTSSSSRPLTPPVVETTPDTQNASAGGGETAPGLTSPPPEPVDSVDTRSFGGASSAARLDEHPEDLIPRSRCVVPALLTRGLSDETRCHFSQFVSLCAEHKSLRTLGMRVDISPFPSFTFSHLIARLGIYTPPPAALYKDAMWLSSPFASASSRVTNPTRCLVRLVSQSADDAAHLSCTYVTRSTPTDIACFASHVVTVVKDYVASVLPGSVMRTSRALVGSDAPQCAEDGDASNDTPDESVLAVVADGNSAMLKLDKLFAARASKARTIT